MSKCRFLLSLLLGYGSGVDEDEQNRRENSNGALWDSRNAFHGIVGRDD